MFFNHVNTAMTYLSWVKLWLDHTLRGKNKKNKLREKFKRNFYFPNAGRKVSRCSSSTRADITRRYAVFKWPQRKMSSLTGYDNLVIFVKGNSVSVENYSLYHCKDDVGWPFLISLLCRPHSSLIFSTTSLSIHTLSHCIYVYSGSEKEIERVKKLSNAFCMVQRS